MSASSSSSSPPERLAGPDLPRGPALWAPRKTRWKPDNTDGLDVVKFVEATIRLTRGSNRGELVKLRHWQGDLYCDAFRLESGYRKYRTYLVWVPRKNSKSLIGSGAALDGMFDEPGAEVYSCAADKDQAKIVFRDVREAVEMSEELSKILKVYRDAIEYPPMGAVYRALSSEAFTKEGLNPSRVIFDEVHAQPNDELWNVMNQGFGTREQPLLLGISTFGAKVDSLGQDSLGYRQYLYCKGVLSGEIDDPTFGCRIYESPADADHRDEKVWFDANPALGDFLSVEDMRAQCRKQPEPDFRTKRLNIWVTGANPALPFGVWEKCAEPGPPPEDGTEVVLGFDGSWSGDSTGIVGCTVGEDPRLFVVDAWEKKPHDTDEWRVNIADVEAAITAACKRWHVLEVACDPYRWQKSLQSLADEGLPVVEFPPNISRMVPAWQRFYDAVMEQRVAHDGDLRLARHVDNLVLKSDARGLRPTKESKMSARRIDLAICAVIAYDRATQAREFVPEPFAVWG